MTMTMDHSQSRHHLGSLHFDSLPTYGHNASSSRPQFQDPWSSAGGYESITKRPQSTMAMPYSSLPAPSAPSLGTSAYNHSDMLQATSQPFDHSAYTTATATPSSYVTSYPGLSYGQSLAAQQQEQAHRPMPNTAHLPQPTSSYNEVLDGARGMVAMSQNDITPRNIYGPRVDRDGYGFPATHSAHSSISSASGYNNSYYGSMDSSVTDYSSASESLDGINSRTLPRPNGLLAHAMPPAPQSMMGSFNSKISSTSQKKHKCKVCEKRFTRPSSLQTHMYSHTGEKPFACNVPGCGRQFSVVSNLRRHAKVHRGERPGIEDASSHGSPDGSWTTASNHE